MKRTSASPATVHNVVMLPGVFNETLRLLMETHEYFHRYGEHDQSKFDARSRSLYCCEMSRITMRLSCIMAWLMVRKAVSSGKMDEKEAMTKYRLDCRDLCMHQNIEVENFLPTYMNYLLDRSFELYRRVSRLDDDMAANLGLHQFAG